MCNDEIDNPRARSNEKPHPRARGEPGQGHGIKRKVGGKGTDKKVARPVGGKGTGKNNVTRSVGGNGTAAGKKKKAGP